jgi:hypothetical protein
MTTHLGLWRRQPDRVEERVRRRRRRRGGRSVQRQRCKDWSRWREEAVATDERERALDEVLHERHGCQYRVCSGGLNSRPPNGEPHDKTSIDHNISQ